MRERREDGYLKTSGNRKGGGTLDPRSSVPHRVSLTQVEMGRKPLFPAEPCRSGWPTGHLRRRCTQSSRHPLLCQIVRGASVKRVMTSRSTLEFLDALSGGATSTRCAVLHTGLGRRESLRMPCHRTLSCARSLPDTRNWLKMILLWPGERGGDVSRVRR